MPIRSPGDEPTIEDENDDDDENDYSFVEDCPPIRALLLSH
jgi:hypothetical protein